MKNRDYSSEFRKKQELAERRRSLPSGAERQQSRKLAQARFTLEAKKKRCDYKGDSMLTLREGNGSYFGVQNSSNVGGAGPSLKTSESC